MPYSVSHAIVALPITKLTQGKVPIAAIIIGAVSPDFPYFLALTPTHAPGHSFIGVLSYCLVPSLAIAYIWFSWLEKPTLQFWHIPQRKYHNEKISIIFLLIGILIGAYSHVLWDATSHSYGAIVKQSDVLQHEIFSRPVYKWNQYLSGLVGLAALILWYLYSCIKNRKTKYTGKFRLGLVIYTLSIALFVFIGMVYRHTDILAEVVVILSITIINGFILGACIYAILANLLARKISV